MELPPEGKKRLYLICGTVFVVLLIVFVGYFQLTAKKTEDKKVVSPPPGTVQMIGSDSFSKSDIEYVRKTYPKADSPIVPSSSNPLPAYEQSVVDEKSIVLQEAKKNNLIQIDDKIFAPNKDWTEYNQSYEKAKEAILSQVEQISVAGIYMYFHNDNPPQNMTIQQAKDITREKMDTLREQLVNGTITIEQAASKIRSDTSLEQIDEVYRKNSYSKLSGRTKDGKIDIGLSDQDNNSLWNIPVGEYSPVFLGYETSGEDVSSRETFWVVYKVLDKHGTGKPYLEWLEQKRKEYETNI